VDHAQAVELFSSYWDEELSADDTTRLEEHLRSCVVCRREFQQFEQAVGTAAALPKAEAPPDFLEGVVQRVRKRSQGRFFAPRRLVERVPYELFSLLMLGVILAIYLILQMAEPAKVNLP
jgi:anti-sigma factor RsiW